jgi:S-DNA-T family DNA segregation ATPase FtsK/SpoIIIE
MRRKKIDKNKILAAIFFMALSIFVFLSLVTYHPSDPVGFSNEPRYLKVRNLFGILGSTIAAPIFESTFGYGALIFPIMMIYLVISSFTRQKWHTILENLTKLLIVGFFTGLVLNLPEGLEQDGQFIHYYPGGFFSAKIIQFLIFFTGKFGTIFLLSISFILYILWILHDISFVVKFWRVTGNFFSSMAESMRGILKRLIKALKSEKKQKSGLEEIIEEESFEWESEPESEITELSEENGKFHIKAPVEPEAFDQMNQSELFKEEESLPPQSNRTDDISGIEKNKNDFPFIQKEYEDEIGTFPPDDEKTTIFQAPGGSQPGKEEELPSMGSGHFVEGELEEPEDLDNILLLKRVKQQKMDRLPTNNRMDFEVEKQAEEKEVDPEDFIQSQLKKFQFPSTDILRYDPQQEKKVTRQELQQNAELLIETLSHFNVEAKLVKVVEGPVVTQYQLKPAQGVKISKITVLQDDLALALRARGIRIIAPIPGKAAIGVEIPNRNRSTVFFKSMVRSEKFVQFEGALPIALGKTINGEVFCTDLAQMPHLLIAGATGTGKSVGLNVIIASLLYRLPPTDVKFVLIDPKRLEFALYEDLKKQYLAYCPELDEFVITEPDNAVLMLQSLIEEMEKRYSKLKEMGVRSVAEYNEKIKRFSKKELKEKFTYEHKHLPYLVVIIDELADLMLSSAKEIEEPIARLTQKARAAGIHLILATQRPSVNVITGIIKANFPVRIAYQVPQKIDSKVILDMSGAEQLIGKGDMLFKSPSFPKPIRIQTALITTEEVEKIVNHIKKQPYFPPYELELVKREEEVRLSAGANGYRDELFEQAKEIVILHQTASASLLQRKLRIGYARAASIIDQLEEAGIVGPPMGSKPRDVLIDKEAYLRGDIE